MSDEKAASLYLTYQTGYVGLHRRANIQAGDWLLVHAGAGGVGTAAIQLGKAAGAKVIATAGGARKTEVCTQLGADHVIDYTSRGLRPDRQGGHRRARRRHRLRPGRRRRLRQEHQVHRLRGPARRRRVHQRPHPRGEGQPPAGQELQRRRPALGAVPEVRAGDLRAGARRAGEARRRPAPSTRWWGRPCRWTRRRRRWPSWPTAAPSARSCWSPDRPPGAPAGRLLALRRPLLRGAGVRRVGRLRDRQAGRAAVPEPAGGLPLRHPRASCGSAGFPGCEVFDCFGAGQQLTQVTFGGRTWREDPAARRRAVRRPAGDAAAARDALVPDRGARRCRPPPRCTTRSGRRRRDRAASPPAPRTELAALDVGAHRARGGGAARPGQRRRPRPGRGRIAGAPTSWAATCAGRDLRDASLRGAYLIGADLRGVDLGAADLLGADLRAADVRGADLSRCLFLTRPQVEAARGDMSTRLPVALERPAHWA